MHPFISFFGTHIQVYGLFMLIALIVSVGGGMLFAYRRGFALWNLVLILGVMSISGVIGARLLYVVTNSTYYRAHPAMIWSFDATGLALTGGLLSAAVVAVILTRILRVNVWKLADTMTPFLGLGIAIARIGCYLNGCCYGHDTHAPWGVHFPLLSQAHQHQIMSGSASFLSTHAVHPTQLYEMAAACIGALLAVMMMRKRAPYGVAFLVFVLWFALFRLINHPLRVLQESATVPGWFYPAVYVGIACVSIFFLWRRWRTSTSEEECRGGVSITIKSKK